MRSVGAILFVVHRDVFANPDFMDGFCCLAVNGYLYKVETRVDANGNKH